MPKALDEDQVRRLAHLARLKLDDDEIRVLRSELGQIIQFFRQIATVDTTGVEPLMHPLAPAETLREDEPGQPFDSDRALRGARRLRGRLFEVPAVLGHESQT